MYSEGSEDFSTVGRNNKEGRNKWCRRTHTVSQCARDHCPERQWVYESTWQYARHTRKPEMASGKPQP